MLICYKRLWLTAAVVLIVSFQLSYGEVANTAYSEGLDKDGSVALSPENVYHVADSTETGNESIVTEAMQLLDRGESEIQFSVEHTRVTLVMGMTGAGKTTMTQLVAGDNSKMNSYEVHGSGFHLIRDEENRISKANIVSKSIFPELVVDRETNEAFYDCPGFADTRNVSIEIANTYFIRKIVEHSESIKILLIVSHNSVRPGHDRTTFLSLMHHMLQFLRQPEEFSHSIAMIVTKVDVRQNDEKVLRSVVNFLQYFLKELERVSFTQRKSDVEFLVNTLLQTDSKGEYKNIQLFRQPEEAGILSEIPAVQANRLQLRQMIFDNPFFTYQTVNVSSFGFSLSPKAQLVIAELMQTLKRRTEATIDGTKVNLIELYNGTVTAERSLDQGKEDFASLVDIIRNVNTNDSFDTLDLAMAFDKAITSFGISSIQAAFQQTYRYGTYMEFLEEMTNVKSADSKVPSVALKIYQTLVVIAEFVGRANVKLLLHHLPNELNQPYEQTILAKLSYEEMKSKLQNDSNSVNQCLSSSANLTLEALLSSYFPVLNDTGLSECANKLDFLVDYSTLGRKLISNVSLDPSGSREVQRAFFEAINAFKSNIESYQQFFNQLDAILEDRTTSDIGQHLYNCDKTKTARFWNPTSLTPDLCYDYSPVRNMQKNMSPGTTAKLKLLNDTLALAPGSLCYNDAVNAAKIIRGHVVHASEVARCLQEADSSRVIVLMATMMVKIDTDLDLDGKSLLIFAPKVVVVGRRKITLDGLPGKAYDSPASVGQEGAPGRRGSDGGHFVAAVLEIQVDQRLDISANGGEGGEGQPGGEGSVDKNLDGRTIHLSDIQHAGKDDINSRYGHRRLEKPCGSSCTTFEAYGQSGSTGKQGAAGGHGGAGGAPGRIILPTKTRNVYQMAHPGLQGRGGRGGKGGPGGRQGTGLIVMRHHDHNNAGKGAAYGSSAGGAGLLIGGIVGAILGPFGAMAGAAIGGAIGGTVGAGAGAGIGAAVGASKITQGQLTAGEHMPSDNVGPKGKDGPDGHTATYNSSLPPTALEKSMILSNHAEYIRFLKGYESNSILYLRIRDYEKKLDVNMTFSK